MKKLKSISLFSFFVGTLVLSTVFSELFYVHPYTVMAVESPGHKECIIYFCFVTPYRYNKTIAFVEPTFTYAAYRNGSFYNFYERYNPITDKLPGGSVTTDLNLLKDRPIPHGPFLYYASPTQKPVIPYIYYFKALLKQVKKTDPLVTNITDVDVHQGKIFQNDGKNAYDVLFLFHNEYATQSEYNNLKQFVINGGTIVFTEANALYAEVSYNKPDDSITLVKGHSWRFDGGSATRSLGERWLIENEEWTGSNFLRIASTCSLYFKNNPFNYTHTEEQYVSNPLAHILLDYHAFYPSDKYFNATVATYQMNYGKGNIINLGIWGHTLYKNPRFLYYFDNVIIPIALGPPVNSSNIYNKQGATSNIVVQGTGSSGAIVNYVLPSPMDKIDCLPNS